MSATTAANRDLPGIYHKAGSLRAERRWALWTAYISLIFAAIIMLAPPVYMFMTSIKTSAEIADLAGTPWWVRNPTAKVSPEMKRQIFEIAEKRNDTAATVMREMIRECLEKAA